MALQFPRGFVITTDEPIDSKLVLTKAQMKTAHDDFMMPNIYFCICSTDNMIYIFDNSNEVDLELGKFRPLAAESSEEALAKYNTLAKKAEDFEKLARELRVYNYFTSTFDGTNLLDFGHPNTEFSINTISAKGLPDSEYCVELSSSPLFKEEPLFEIQPEVPSIVLYQTGLLKDITSINYAYDSINFLTNTLHRYCKVITFRDLLTSVKNTKWTYTSKSGNGRLQISYTTLQETFGVFAGINFVIKTSDPNFPFKISGVGSTNLGIDGLTNNEISAAAIAKGTSEAKRRDALLTDTAFIEAFGDIKLVFKLVSPIEENLSDYNLKLLMPYITTTEEDQIITNIFGTIQASYYSKEDLFYSKEQTDTKFVTIASLTERTCYKTLLDKEATSELLDTLNGERTVLAFADFDTNDGTVPFTGPTIFNRQYIKYPEGHEPKWESYYIVNSKGNIYRWNSPEEVILLYGTEDFEEGPCMLLGNTKITEVQLKKLLGLLETMEAVEEE